MSTYYSKSDNVSKLRSQVDEVKDVMTQNIERVLERGEKLDDLVDKTEDLEASVGLRSVAQSLVFCAVFCGQ
jgi:hypothetical protein